MYSEEIFTKAFKNEEGGIRVDGIPLNNLRYADDTVLFAENMSDLQNMLNNVITSSLEEGPNEKKAKSWKELRVMTTWGQMSTVLWTIVRK